ncbi:MULTISPECIES: PAS domain-containing protein [Leptospira]|uniref:PAS domain S-box protein n=3 Tax=Leptospira weilii TaxID=28184 RepID=A0A828Z4Z4_9LEPT|nr:MULTISPECIES: PAS domain-containing protein [Leptospira]EMY13443.1 PAS domain S-box protein [Leptospira weilii str. Ecochallenge]EKR64618.1 PAS domain S-box protein [Leptospira weilii str. 2006001853]EMJ67131.1 PAS domain S-box protein [Leptospira sp. P2653]EMN44441.1 PAS domain S-box protein [Leptospira weilii str. LNT 1234]EMN89309.1 PAS domain S-box protein [Leptospira weilii str. UI 13098]
MNLSSILISYFYQYPHAMFITNRCGMIEYINPVFETLSGYNRNELIGQNPRLFQAGVHDPNFYEELWKTILSGKEYEGNFLNRNGSGETISWKERITPLRDETGNISNFLCRVDIPSKYEKVTNTPEENLISAEGAQSEKARELLFSQLQKDYGLTCQEAKICERLVAGQTRASLIQQLGVHSGTLKNHLKAIYRKTIEKDLAQPGQGRDKLQRLTMFLIRLC